LPNGEYDVNKVRTYKVSGFPVVAAHLHATSNGALAAAGAVVCSACWQRITRMHDKRTCAKCRRTVRDKCSPLRQAPLDFLRPGESFAEALNHTLICVDCLRSYQSRKVRSSR